MSGFFEHISSTTAQAQSESDAAESANTAAESAEAAAESAAEAASSAADAVITKNLAVSAKDDAEDARDDAEAALASVSSAISGALTSSNNLSDLNNANTARTNLGLGTAATTAVGDYATAAQADQVVSLTGAGATTISGTYPNFTIDSANNTYTAGAGITLTGNTFDNSAPDQTVTLTGAGTTTVSGTYPNFTVTGTGTAYTAGAGLSLTGSVFSVSGVTEGSLTIEGDSASNSSANPELILKNTESSATDQQIGAIKFEGEDANGNTDTYALIGADTADTTDGSEDGRLYVRTLNDGNLYKKFAIGSKGIEVYGGQASNSNANPEIVLKNLETAVGVGDQSLGIIKFQGKDTNDNTTDYGLITGYASVPTDGSEDGKVTIRVMDEGSYVTPFGVNKNGADVRGRLNLHSDTADHLDPDVAFINNEVDPSDNNVLGQMWFYGNNSSNTNRHFADIQAISSDVTDGEEDGKLYFSVDNDGTRSRRLTVDKHGIAVDNRIFIAGSGGNSDVDNNWHDPDLIFANYQDAVDGNVLGQCLYYGDNDAATPERELYAYTEARSSSVAKDSEYGAYGVYLMNNGTREETLSLHTNGSKLRTHAFTIEGKSDAATTNANPTLVLSNDEPSANNQTLGIIAFDGNNSAGNGRYYGYISGTALNPTENVETGRMNFHIRNGQGTTESILQLTRNGADIARSLFIQGPTGATAGSNPSVVIRNNETASPDQLLGSLKFQGKNNNGLVMDYAYLQAVAENVTAGQEESRITFDVEDGSGSRVEKLRVDKNGIDVSGALVATGNITAFSDKRLKEEIRPIDNPLEKVQKISGNTYSRNDLGDPHRRYAGVIAQEIEAVLPEAVSETLRGTKTVDYSGVISLLVESVKELKAEVDELKSKMEVRGVS